MDSKTSPVYVALHRLSRTHLTLDNISNNFAAFKHGFSNLDAESSSNVQSQLYKTHVDVVGAKDCFKNPARVIYVVRDGKDVMVSLYHYVKAHRADAADLLFADFLTTPNPYEIDTYDGEMNGVEYWNYHVKSWIEDDQFDKLIVSFDQWRTRFDETVSKVASFLDLHPTNRLKRWPELGRSHFSPKACGSLVCPIGRPSFLRWAFMGLERVFRPRVLGFV